MKAGACTKEKIKTNAKSEHSTNRNVNCAAQNQATEANETKERVRRQVGILREHPLINIARALVIDAVGNGNHRNEFTA